MIDSGFDICFYDANGHEEMVSMLVKLGYKGAYFLVPFADKNGVQDILKSSKKDGFDERFGILIDAETPSQLAKMLSKAKNLSDIIAVTSKNEEVFRKASQTKGVSIITNFIDDTGKSLADYVTMNFCVDNEVFVNFGFSEVLKREKKSRAQYLSTLFESAKIARKRKAKALVTSSAYNEWETRSGSDMIAFRKVLGL